MSQFKKAEFLAKVKEQLKVLEEQRKKREEKEKQRQKDIYANNPRRQFEMEIADLFEKRGWQVQLGPGSNDGGIDIIIKKASEAYLVQCKHYWGSKFVGPKHIRDFQGAIDLYEKQYNIKVGGIFITSGKTTYYARQTANTLGIKLWDKWNRRDRILSF